MKKLRQNYKRINSQIYYNSILSNYLRQKRLYNSWSKNIDGISFVSNKLDNFNYNYKVKSSQLKQCQFYKDDENGINNDINNSNNRNPLLDLISDNSHVIDCLFSSSILYSDSEEDISDDFSDDFSE